MNTNLKDKNSIVKFIKDHANDSIDIEHESKMIMYRFLSEVERIMDEEKINKKDLAIKIGTSSSYITQIFRGSKLLNLPTLAKIQVALNFKFKIEAISESAWYVPNVDDEFMKCLNALHRIDRHGFWVSKPDKEELYKQPTKLSSNSDMQHEHYSTQLPNSMSESNMHGLKIA